ncbi:hypothetical protein Thiosp_04599 [Thiorhodovibrio litoralis]|nr:hypothetical protein Thiosp_04599 [Thiorhodovibrio litoralis]
MSTLMLVQPLAKALALTLARTSAPNPAQIPELNPRWLSTCNVPLWRKCRPLWNWKPGLPPRLLLAGCRPRSK